MLKTIISIKRVYDGDQKILDRVECTFDTNFFPESILLRGYIFQLTPAASRLKRCFKWHIFGHTVNQCRFTYPAYELCAGRQLTTYCFNKNIQARCRNSERRHVASSFQYLVYIHKFNILKFRYSNG